jgi:hypothetical protein
MKNDQPPSIRDCVKSAFALAHDAKKLADTFASMLPNLKEPVAPACPFGDGTHQ